MPHSLLFKRTLFIQFSIFFLKIDSFLIQCILISVSSPSIPLSSSLPPLLSESTPCLSLIREEQASKRVAKHVKIKYSKKKQNQHIEVGQCNSTVGNESERRHKNQRPIHSHMWESHKNTTLKTVIFMKEPGTEWCWPRICCLVFCEEELCSTDLKDPFLLVFFITSGFYILSISS